MKVVFACFSMMVLFLNININAFAQESEDTEEVREAVEEDRGEGETPEVPSSDSTEEEPELPDSSPKSPGEQGTVVTVKIFWRTEQTASVDGYAVGEYALDANQKIQLDEFYENIKNTDFDTTVIRLQGYADSIVPDGVDPDEVNYPVGQKRCFWAMQYLVNKGLPGEDMYCGSEHTSLSEQGPQYRRVVIMLRRAYGKVLLPAGQSTTIPTSATETAGSGPDKEAVQQLVRAEVERQKQEKNREEEQKYARLRAEILVEIRRDLHKMMFRLGDFTIAARFFLDPFSEYKDKGVLGEISLSVAVFPWMHIRGIAGLGYEDLGLADSLALRFELPFGSQDQFRGIFGIAYRGFDLDMVTRNTKGDQWLIPLGFSWDVATPAYLELCSGVGVVTRVVDDVGEIRFEDEDVRDFFWNIDFAIGLRFDISGKRNR